MISEHPELVYQSVIDDKVVQLKEAGDQSVKVEEDQSDSEKIPEIVVDLVDQSKKTVQRNEPIVQ